MSRLASPIRPSFDIDALLKDIVKGTKISDDVLRSFREWKYQKKISKEAQKELLIEFFTKESQAFFNEDIEFFQKEDVDEILESYTTDRKMELAELVMHMNVIVSLFSIPFEAYHFIVDFMGKKFSEIFTDDEWSTKRLKESEEEAIKASASTTMNKRSQPRIIAQTSNKVRKSWMLSMYSQVITHLVFRPNGVGATSARHHFERLSGE